VVTRGRADVGIGARLENERDAGVCVDPDAPLDLASSVGLTPPTNRKSDTDVEEEQRTAGPACVEGGALLRRLAQRVASSGSPGCIAVQIERARLEDLRFELLQQVTEGDSVASRFAVHGTRPGDPCWS
jgi:hypothetical protein